SYDISLLRGVFHGGLDFVFKIPLHLVGCSDESSSSSTIGALLDWTSPPRERDIDEVFSLGGKHDAQASSSHLAHDPLRLSTRATPTHSTEPEAAPPSQSVSPYPYAFDQVIGGDSVCSIQRRLLDQWGERPPAYEVLQRSLYEAQDRFELKLLWGTKDEIQSIPPFKWFSLLLVPVPNSSRVVPMFGTSILHGYCNCDPFARTKGSFCGNLHEQSSFFDGFSASHSCSFHTSGYLVPNRRPFLISSIIELAISVASIVQVREEGWTSGMRESGSIDKKKKSSPLEPGKVILNEFPSNSQPTYSIHSHKDYNTQKTPYLRSGMSDTSGERGEETQAKLGLGY
ncbi:unnamed protein product, partial [Ilex paraguariensis]